MPNKDDMSPVSKTVTRSADWTADGYKASRLVLVAQYTLARGTYRARCYVYTQYLAREGRCRQWVEVGVFVGKNYTECLTSGARVSDREEAEARLVMEARRHQAWLARVPEERYLQYHALAASRAD